MSLLSRLVTVSLTLVLALGCADGQVDQPSSLPPKGEPGVGQQVPPGNAPQPPAGPGQEAPPIASPEPNPPPARPAPPARPEAEREPPAPPAQPEAEREPPAEREPAPEREPPAEREPAPEREPPAEQPPREEPRPEPPPERREPPQGEPQAPEPPQNAPRNVCDSVNYEGRCEGDVAVWCDNGRVARTHCGRRFGATCDWVDAATGFFCKAPQGYSEPPEPPPAPPQNEGPVNDCGNIDYTGACQGHVAVWCDGGSLSQVDCSTRGQTCDWVDDTTGYYCVNAPGEEERAAPPQAEDENNCGNIDRLGTCEGEVAVWCSNGSLRRVDCRTEHQQTCGWVDQDSGYFCKDDEQNMDEAPVEPEPAPEPVDPPEPQDNCNGITYEGTCDGDTAVWCTNGELQTTDCTTLGQTCGWAGGGSGYYCIDRPEPGQQAPEPEPEPEPVAPPADGCQGVDFLGECAGDVARYCAGGELQEVDCTGLGMSCGWIDDDTGYYCQ